MIAKSRAGAVSASDMERLERASRTVVGDSSQSYWLLSSLLSQLKQDGYKLSEPSLFDKTISSLSASMTLQTSLVSRITDFVVSKRNLSLVMSKFLSPLCRRGNCWFRPGLGIFLFDQALLEKTTGQVKEDSIISSLVSLSRFAKLGMSGKRLSSSSSTSPSRYPLRNTPVQSLQLMVSVQALGA